MIQSSDPRTIFFLVNETFHDTIVMSVCFPG